VRVLSLLLLALATVPLSRAQAVYTQTEVDLNGKRVAAGPSDVVTKDGHTEVSRSINGHVVPLEKTEEHVLRQDANGKTVERLIQRYDQTGIPMARTKEIIEEKKLPGGGSSTTRAIYTGDINGNLQLQERSSTQTRVAGNSENSETVIERPTLNGALEQVSRKSSEKIKNGDNYQETSTTYVADQNGSFTPAVKVSKNVTKTNGQSTENIAEYETGQAGELRLHSQRVQNTVKHADGSEETQLSIYGKEVAGTTGSFDSNKLSLTEQQHIERRKTSGDTVIETVEVQRPSLANPNTLGPPKQLSETICKGQCDKPEGQ
jgi:hypothetical protein